MLSIFISKFYNIIIVILFTILIMSGIEICFLNIDKKNITNNLNEANKKIVLLESNNISLKASIEDQNKKIEANKNNYDLKIKQYEQWKNQPAEVKYKYITKEVRSNECEDIKKSIDDSINRLHNNRLYN